jgi:hypothetical protein
MRITNSGGKCFIQPGLSSIQNSGTVLYFTQYSNTTNTMAIDTSAQNVGIGTKVDQTLTDKLTVQDIGNLALFGSSTEGLLRFATDNENICIQSYTNTTTKTGNLLQFSNYNGNSTTMTINTSTLQVGIGTNIPLYTLDVNGVLNLRAGTPNTPSDSGVDLVNRVSTYIRFDTAGSFSDFAYLRQIGGFDSMHITLDMHNDGNDGNFSIRKISSLAGGPNTISTLFNVDTTGTVTAINFSTTGTTRSNIINSNTISSGTLRSNLISSNTISSNIILSAIGDFDTISSNTYIRGVDTSNTTIFPNNTSFPLITNYNGTAGINIIKYSSDANLGLSFSVYNTSNLTSSIFITSSANVGIKTNSPGYELDVNGVLNLRAGTPSTVTDQSVDLANRTNTYIRFDTAGTNDDFAYLRQIGGSDAMHITLDMHDNANDGNFSIRKVNSAANPDGSVSTLFNVSTTGTVTANNYNTFTSSIVNFSGGQTSGTLFIANKVGILHIHATSQSRTSSHYASRIWSIYYANNYVAYELASVNNGMTINATPNTSGVLVSISNTSGNAQTIIYSVTYTCAMDTIA